MIWLKVIDSKVIAAWSRHSPVNGTLKYSTLPCGLEIYQYTIFQTTFIEIAVYLTVRVKMTSLTYNKFVIEIT